MTFIFNGLFGFACKTTSESSLHDYNGVLGLPGVLICAILLHLKGHGVVWMIYLDMEWATS